MQVPVPLPDPVRSPPAQSSTVVDDQRGREAAIAAGNYAPTRAPRRNNDVPLSIPSDIPVRTPDWWAAPVSTFSTVRQKQEVYLAGVFPPFKRGFQHLLMVKMFTDDITPTLVFQKWPLGTRAGTLDGCARKMLLSPNFGRCHQWMGHLWVLECESIFRLNLGSVEVALEPKTPS